MIKFMLLANNDTALEFDKDHDLTRKLEFLEHYPAVWSVRVSDRFQYVFDCNCMLNMITCKADADKVEAIIRRGFSIDFYRSPKFDHEHELRDWLNDINSHVNASWSPSVGFNQYLV